MTTPHPSNRLLIFCLPCTEGTLPSTAQPWTRDSLDEIEQLLARSLSQLKRDLPEVASGELEFASWTCLPRH